MLNGTCSQFISKTLLCVSLLAYFEKTMLWRQYNEQGKADKFTPTRAAKLRWLYTYMGHTPFRSITGDIL